MNDRGMLDVLVGLCHAYAANDTVAIAKLEPEATRIGEELNRRGGIQEMRRIFTLVPSMQGKRTLEMHWAVSATGVGREEMPNGETL